MDYRFEDADGDFVQAVWEKGRHTNKVGFGPEEWRQDIVGHMISRVQHGRRESKFGWEIDHIKPVALGGSDDLDNLQPLYWRTNVSKGDQYPWT